MPRGMQWRAMTNRDTDKGNTWEEKESSATTMPEEVCMYVCVKDAPLMAMSERNDLADYVSLNHLTPLAQRRGHRRGRLSLAGKALPDESILLLKGLNCRASLGLKWCEERRHDVATETDFIFILIWRRAVFSVFTLPSTTYCCSILSDHRL